MVSTGATSADKAVRVTKAGPISEWSIIYTASMPQARCHAVLMPRLDNKQHQALPWDLAFRKGLCGPKKASVAVLVAVQAEQQAQCSNSHAAACERCKCGVQICVKTALAEYTAVRAAPAYKAAFAHLSEQAALCFEVRSAVCFSGCTCSQPCCQEQSRALYVLAHVVGLSAQSATEGCGASILAPLSLADLCVEQWVLKTLRPLATSTSESQQSRVACKVSSLALLRGSAMPSSITNKRLITEALSCAGLLPQSTHVPQPCVHV